MNILEKKNTFYILLIALLILLIILVVVAVGKFGGEADVDSEDNLSESDLVEEEIDPGDLTEEYIKEKILGYWQSLDNEKYSLEFGEGKMVENLPPSHNHVISPYSFVTYEEGPINKAARLRLPEDFNKEGIFIEQLLDGRPFYYKVLKIDDEEMRLLYLNTRVELTFIKSVREEN